MDRRDEGGLDELLTPTLGGQNVPQRDTDLPWRLGSQVYVAFFGGVLAVTMIAFLNARRLRLPDKTLAAIVAIGVVGLAAALTAVGLVGGSSGASARLPARLCALAAYGGMFLLQRRADRIHHFHSRLDDPYDSLIKPGLIACFTIGIVEAILIFAVADVT